MADTNSKGGAVAWMTRNPVAANLLMLVLLVGGLLALLGTKQEVFPEFSLDAVTVHVQYPGASPDEVEQGILLAIEERVRGLDGVKRVTGTAEEGVARVEVELLRGAQPDRVLSDVKSEVDAIQSMPRDAEEPIVSLASSRRQVVSLILSGDQPLSTLHALAERAREDLQERPGVTQVTLSGIPPLELGIEIPRQTLETYDLTLDELARIIGDASVELPGGAIDTRGGEILVRMDERRRAGAEFADIIVRATADGALVRLGDIATIRDGYADTKQASYFDGRPAVRLTVFRVGDETPREVAATVRAYADELRAELPPEIQIEVWSDDSEMLDDRVDLLLRNAQTGLLLVLVILALFLDLRLALWVSLGIPISFLGAFVFLGVADASINMITLFAFIVTLGMVVDDAIVVGESTYAKIEAGAPRLRAAVEAAREMATPVTFAILTTIAAFMPMLFVPGTMGKVFRMIPIVVIAVLLVSLVESFFVLPAHLGHGRERPPARWLAPLTWLQGKVRAGLSRFTARRYRPLLLAALRYRYVTVAASLALLLVTLGAVASGLVPFNFFPQISGDVVVAAARLPYGANVEDTERVRQELERAATRALDELVAAGEAEPGIVRGVYTRVGEGRAPAGPGAGAPEAGSHLVTIELGLVSADERSLDADALAARWREQLPPLPGVETLTIDAKSGPSAGADVALQLSHREDAVLARASDELAQRMRGLPTLTNIENEFAAGKPQLDFHLRPRARATGLTTQEIARQLRSSYFGAESLREQRGRNELKVMTRLSADQRRSQYDLEHLQIRTPQGGYVTLGHVVSFERGQAPAAIRREDGRRVVTVSAALRGGVESPRPTLESIERDLLPALRERYPGLEVSTVGAQREQRDAFASLGRGYIMALIGIYAMLAVSFRSYSQPLIIMSVIPFGLVGAVLGHVALGYSLSLMSVFGFVALSGVVVNDSLVLIDAANSFRSGDEGMGPFEAITAAGVRRLRPILLTSLTTFFGLVPMILESSAQARFLIPMAISLGFGVLLVTGIVLVLVPAIYGILEDAHALFAGEAAPGPGSRVTLPEIALDDTFSGDEELEEEFDLEFELEDDEPADATMDTDAPTGP